MRKMLVILALLAFVGCEPADNEVTVEWVIERDGRSPKEIQGDLDTMAAHGFRVRDDDELEQSGHYILFSRWVRSSERTDVLQRVQTALNTSRGR